MTLDDRSFFPVAPRGTDPARLVVVTPPAVELWTASDAEVSQHFRRDSGDDDALVNLYLKSARIYFENATGLALITQTLRAEFDHAPLAAGIELPRAPLIAVEDEEEEESFVVNGITYLDTDGAEQTLDLANIVQPRAGMPRCFSKLRLASGGAWPDLGDFPGAFRVEFNCGFGPAASDVPSDIRHAVLMLARWFYQQPDGINVGNIVNELPFSLSSVVEINRVAFIG